MGAIGLGRTTVVGLGAPADRAVTVATAPGALAEAGPAADSTIDESTVQLSPGISLTLTGGK
ncbi:MAG TPA: hypothetical protein VKU86_10105 [Acidimicrobiales bacterium]|nr:hypothetical protein [Acidimicrobiales bacterium]